MVPFSLNYLPTYLPTYRTVFTSALLTPSGHGDGDAVGFFVPMFRFRHAQSTKFGLAVATPSTLLLSGLRVSQTKHTIVTAVTLNATRIIHGLNRFII